MPRARAGRLGAPLGAKEQEGGRVGEVTHLETPAASLSRHRIELSVGLFAPTRDRLPRLREQLFGVGDLYVRWDAESVDTFRRLASAMPPDAMLLDLHDFELDVGAILAAAGQTPVVALSPRCNPEEPAWTRLKMDESASAATTLAAAMSAIRSGGLRRNPLTAMQHDSKSDGSGRAEAIEWLLASVSDGRVLQIPVGEVLWVGAIHNSVRVCSFSRDFELRVGIAALLQRLPQALFERIHRSTIVNLDAVRHIEPIVRGQARVTLANGHVLSATSSGHQRLVQRLRERGLAR